MGRFVAWVLGALLLLAGCSSPEPDTEAQERVLRDYIAAVQQGDRARLAELAGPRVDAAADIEAKISAVGGREWRAVQVTWDRGQFAGSARAQITATGPDGRPVRDSVDLTRDADTWRVALGMARDGGEPAATASS